MGGAGRGGAGGGGLDSKIVIGSALVSKLRCLGMCIRIKKCVYCQIPYRYQILVKSYFSSFLLLKKDTYG